MDFFTGFLVGYFTKEIFAYLKKLSNWDYNNRQGWDKEWDFISYQEDDLP